MSHNAEDKIMSDVAPVGSVGGPERNVSEQTQASGSTPMLMRARSVSPRPRYTPYGTRASDVKTGTSALVSRVMRSRAQLSAQCLREQLEDIRTRLSAATAPLSAQVQETSQSAKQTAAIA